MSTEEERCRLLSAAEFQHWEWDSSHPAGPGAAGVYALIGDDFEPVYIGQSGNLPLRFVQHKREGSKTFSFIKYYHEPDLVSRLRLESIMILLYLPKYNKALNIGFAPGKIWEIKWPGKSYTHKSKQPLRPSKSSVKRKPTVRRSG
jgi:hypothetical protein